MSDWDGFIGRLSGSTHAVMVVAHWLHKKGYELNIPAIRYAPSSKESLDYVDSGDIMSRKGDGDWERIEVKGIGTQFTCREDWPHPFMIVSNKKAVDRANPLPRAYVVVSKDLTHCAIIRNTTRDRWREKELTPKTTNVPEMFYVVDNDVPRFIKL